MFKVIKADKKEQAKFDIEGVLRANPQIRRSRAGQFYLNVGVDFERDGVTLTAWGPVMLEGPASYKLESFLQAVNLPVESTEVDFGVPITGSIPGHEAVFKVNGAEVKLTAGLPVRVTVVPEEFNGRVDYKIQAFK